MKKSDQVFLEMLMENTGVKLVYGYHLIRDRIISEDNKKRSGHMETLNFLEVLNMAYCEPMAFTLTDSDKLGYSNQELALINAVVERERQRAQEGCEAIQLDLNDETIEMLEAYKVQHNLTTEEAIINILKEFIERYKDQNNGAES